MVSGRKPDLLAKRAPSDPRQEVDPADAGGTIDHLDPPAELTDEALEVWQTILPPLIESKVLREDDLPLTIELCESIALAKEFRTRLWQELKGLNDPDEVKRLRTSYNQMLSASTSLASEFGLSPVSRVRLGLTKLQGQSLLDAIGDRS